MRITARAFNYILITKTSVSIKFLIKSQEFFLLSPCVWHQSSTEFLSVTSQAWSTLHMANNRLKVGFPSALECNNYTTKWVYFLAKGFTSCLTWACHFLTRQQHISENISGKWRVFFLMKTFGFAKTAWLKWVVRFVSKNLWGALLVFIAFFLVCLL